jgi:uncharacterized protein
MIANNSIIACEELGEKLEASIRALPSAPPPCPSPCISVCVMDAAHGWCTGCLRTLDEIAAWSRMGDADKYAVLALLPGREAEFAQTVAW